MSEKEKEPPICSECRKAKVKCTKVYPCARCTELGLTCVPHLRKRTARDRKGTLDAILSTFRAYVTHLPPEARERLAWLRCALIYKLMALHSPQAQPPACLDQFGTSPGQSFRLPSAAAAQAELDRVESWAPQEILALRRLHPLSAGTLFGYAYEGRYRYEPNRLFAEWFGSAEQIAADDRRAGGLISPEQFAAMHGAAGGRAPRPEESGGLRPPDLVHRMVALEDHVEFMMDLGKAVVAHGYPCHAEGLYRLEMSSGQRLCQVARWIWLSRGGHHHCMFFSVQPLPESKYLKGGGKPAAVGGAVAGEEAVLDKEWVGLREALFPFGLDAYLDEDDLLCQPVDMADLL